MADRMFEGLVHGPETLAVKDGAIYTGIQGGQIVKIDGDKIIPIAKIGKHCGKSRKLRRQNFILEIKVYRTMAVY